MTRLACLAWGMLCWLVMGMGSAWANCAPELVKIQSAPAQPGSASPFVRPASGWVDVSLPNLWRSGLDQDQNTVWYRIDWQLRCGRYAYAVPAEPVALGIDSMSLAGEVYSNETLVWRDLSMTEPLSRSWNTPRWWVLPETSLRDGINSVWVKVVGTPELGIGLGELRLGSVDAVQSIYKQRWWNQRSVFMLTLGINIAFGGLFLVVWLMRRQERSFGWYAATSLSWAAYLGTLLATTSQPWHEALSVSRLNIALFAMYVGAFCMFIWRFGSQQFPRTERLLGLCVLVAVFAACLTPRAGLMVVFTAVWYGLGAVLILNCLQFQWYVWRPKAQGRNLHNICLGLFLLLLLAVAVHDMWCAWQGHSLGCSWNPVIAPLASLLMALLLGGRLAQGMRSIEQFNGVLEERVNVAKQELEQAVKQAHVHALTNAKLQERVQISHDLHDGLGGTIVRGLAMVEQAPAMVPKERMLSMLKSMRDDLRQVIDHGSSADDSIPESPLQWMAPVRHRFSRIFDEINVATSWRIMPQWPSSYRPTALQCLGLTRLVEEALANIVKHSKAKHVRVSVFVQEDESDPASLSVYLEDDGIGFDVTAVQKAGVTVGYRSMATRAERMGAVFYVDSGPSGTLVCARVQMAMVVDMMAAYGPQSMDDPMQPAPEAPDWSQQPHTA